MGKIANVFFQKILLRMNGGNQSVADVISDYVHRRGTVEKYRTIQAIRQRVE